MTINSVICGIISLPRRFHETGDKSIYTLLLETGYANIRDQVTVDAIRVALSKHPKSVADWFQYSCDKRTTGGWYLKEAGSGEFIVGSMANDERTNPHQETYHDKLSACSVFVKREIDSIT